MSVSTLLFLSLLFIFEENSSYRFDELWYENVCDGLGVYAFVIQHNKPVKPAKLLLS